MIKISSQSKLNNETSEKFPFEYDHKKKVSLFYSDTETHNIRVYNNLYNNAIKDGPTNY